MKEKEYLNEENYQKIKKGLKTVGIVIMIVGMLLGAFIIYMGYQDEQKYEDEKIAKVDTLEKELEALRLQEKELSNQHLSLSSYEENVTYMQNLTRVKQDIMNKESALSKAQSDFGHTPLIFKIVPGIMVIIFTLALGGSFLLRAHAREITAFQVQQVMPIAKEGMEKVAPTLGKVGKQMAEEMAPVYGEIAEEITKGIERGKKGK